MAPSLPVNGAWVQEITWPLASIFRNEFFMTAALRINPALAGKMLKA